MSKNFLLFAADNCISIVPGFLKKLKGEERKVKNKIVEDKLQIRAHNGSGCESWNILSNLLCDKHFVDFIKNQKALLY